MMRQALFFITVLIILIFAGTGCRKEPLKINYELGSFPDSVIALTGLNTQYDDYNMDIEAGRHQALLPVVFSSNRGSQGGQFDLVYGYISYTFGQTTGQFTFGSETTTDAFLERLTAAFNSDGDELGPYRFFNRQNGLEYMAAASGTGGEGLDIVYLSYVPAYPAVPFIGQPVPASVFNSPFDDAYLSLNSTLDTAWFCSDRSGNFDIYSVARPAGLTLDEWFTSPPATAARVDSVNSSHNEKCPFVLGRYMVFASDMPGGLGGYDLWYSVFRDGKWSAPVNMGPGINTPSNEYRPVLGSDNRFENHFLIFSSDRPGGKGGYDLYFTGVTLTK